MTEYIEREAALNASRKVYIECLSFDGGSWLDFIKNGREEIPDEEIPDEIPVVLKRDIAALPAADVRPVIRGKWKWSLADNGWADHTCSVCGFTKNTDIHVRLGWSFCPNCGADMTEAQ